MVSKREQSRLQVKRRLGAPSDLISQLQLVIELLNKIEFPVQAAGDKTRHKHDFVDDLTCPRCLTSEESWQ